MNIELKDRKKIVEVLEYLLEHESDTTVEKLMKDCGISFEEYRMVSDLAMPCERLKSELSSAVHRANYYKGLCYKLMRELGKNESELHLLAWGGRADVVQAGGEGDDGDDGHPEDWAV